MLQMGLSGMDEDETINLPTGEALSVHIVTWNCGDKSPPDDLAPLLPVGVHDIYAIGLQECGPKQKWFKKLTSHLCSTEAARVARARCQASMHSKKGEEQRFLQIINKGIQAEDINYCLLNITSLWDIHALIFVRSDLRQRITNLSFCTEATGLAHVLGNKGGACVGFCIDNTTSFAFVTSHLAARASRLTQRQENFEDIIRGVRLDAHPQMKSIQFLHRCDYVLWFGDLNYRVNFGAHGTDEEFKSVLGMVHNRMYDQLLPHDQLRKEMGKNAVFLGFQEASINFAPTYRLVKGSAEYSNKKNQNPSYTDRVLVRTAPGLKSKTKILEYQCCHDLMSSDHRPVKATVQLMILPPFVLRNPITDRSVLGCCIINFLELAFVVAPDVSDPKCKTSRYDGFSGPMVATFHSCLFISSYATAPSSCEDPTAAVSHRRRGSVQGTIESSAPDDSPKEFQLGGTELPKWNWRSSETPLIVPSVSDTDFIQQQLIVIAIRKHSAEGPVVGYCELPLSEAVKALKAETLPTSPSRTSMPPHRSHRRASTISHLVSGPKLVVNPEVGEDFVQHTAMNGKWTGTLSGRVCITYFDGNSKDDDEEEIVEKISQWRQMLARSRKQAPPPTIQISLRPDTVQLYGIDTADLQIVSESDIVEVRFTGCDSHFLCLTLCAAIRYKEIILHTAYDTGTHF
jgi:hypothetical protein